MKSDSPMVMCARDMVRIMTEVEQLVQYVMILMFFM